MKHHKQLTITFLFSILLLFMGQPVFAADNEKQEQADVKDTILEDMSLDVVQAYWNELVDDYGCYITELEKTSIYEFIKNNGSFSLKDSLIGLIKYLFYELLLNGKLLGLLLMLTLFSIILQTMQSAFERNAVSKIDRKSTRLNSSH